MPSGYLWPFPPYKFVIGFLFVCMGIVSEWYVSFLVHVKFIYFLFPHFIKQCPSFNYYRPFSEAGALGLL